MSMSELNLNLIITEKSIEIKIICRDITKRKLAEDALKVEEEKYRSITNNLNVGIYQKHSR